MLLLLALLSPLGAGTQEKVLCWWFQTAAATKYKQ